MPRSIVLALAAVLLVAPSAPAQVFDHLKCYKIKDSAPKAAYKADLLPSNGAFTLETGCAVKVPAKLLCIDVAKSNVSPNPPGAPPAAPSQTYLCYKLKCAGATPSLNLTDQFGTRPVQVGAAKLLCAPVIPPTTSTTTTTIPVCLPSGQPCVSSAQCCSSLCNANVCA